jgi:flagellar hook-basal body complex protein FliE
MTIPAIGAIASLPSLSSLTAAAPAAAPATTASSGTDFASVLSKGLDSLQASQTNADTLAVKAATGDLTDISQYTIAATQASLATQLASTLTTKAVDSFNQIMGLQA